METDSAKTVVTDRQTDRQTHALTTVYYYM
jgi:hypothetical protein